MPLDPPALGSHTVGSRGASKPRPSHTVRPPPRRAGCPDFSWPVESRRVAEICPLGMRLHRRHRSNDAPAVFGLRTPPGMTPSVRLPACGASSGRGGLGGRSVRGSAEPIPLRRGRRSNGRSDQSRSHRLRALHEPRICLQWSAFAMNRRRSRLILDLLRAKRSHRELVPIQEESTTFPTSHD